MRIPAKGLIELEHSTFMNPTYRHFAWPRPPWGNSWALIPLTSLRYSCNVVKTGETFPGRVEKSDAEDGLKYTPRGSVGSLVRAPIGGAEEGFGEGLAE